MGASESASPAVALKCWPDTELCAMRKLFVAVCPQRQVSPPRKPLVFALSSEWESAANQISYRALLSALSCCLPVVADGAGTRRDWDAGSRDLGRLIWWCSGRGTCNLTRCAPVDAQGLRSQTRCRRDTRGGETHGYPHRLRPK